MSDSKSLDGVVVAFMESGCLAFLDLRWDGGFTANIPGDVILDKLGEYRIFDDDSALRWSDIPVIGLRTIPINDGGIGRCVNEVGELFNSTRIGIMNAGKKVEGDETGLVLHGDIIADGTFVS